MSVEVLYENVSENRWLAFLARNMCWLPSYGFMAFFLVTGEVSHYSLAVAFALLPILRAFRGI